MVRNHYRNLMRFNKWGCSACSVSCAALGLYQAHVIQKALWSLWWRAAAGALPRAICSKSGRKASCTQLLLYTIALSAWLIRALTNFHMEETESSSSFWPRASLLMTQSIGRAARQPADWFCRGPRASERVSDSTPPSFNLAKVAPGWWFEWWRPWPWRRESVSRRSSRPPRRAANNANALVPSPHAHAAPPPTPAPPTPPRPPRKSAADAASWRRRRPLLRLSRRVSRVLVDLRARLFLYAVCVCSSCLCGAAEFDWSPCFAQMWVGVLANFIAEFHPDFWPIF